VTRDRKTARYADRARCTPSLRRNLQVPSRLNTVPSPHIAPDLPKENPPPKKKPHRPPHPPKKTPHKTVQAGGSPRAGSSASRTLTRSSHRHGIEGMKPTLDDSRPRQKNGRNLGRHQGALLVKPRSSSASEEARAKPARAASSSFMRSRPRRDLLRHRHRLLNFDLDEPRLMACHHGERGSLYRVSPSGEAARPLRSLSPTRPPHPGASSCRRTPDQSRRRWEAAMEDVGGGCVFLSPRQDSAYSGRSSPTDPRSFLLCQRRGLTRAAIPISHLATRCEF